MPTKKITRIVRSLFFSRSLRNKIEIETSNIVVSRLDVLLIDVKKKSKKFKTNLTHLHELAVNFHLLHISFSLRKCESVMRVLLMICIR